MALFDSTISIHAPAEIVWRETVRVGLKGSIYRQEPERLLVITQFGLAYIYRLEERSDEETRLRCVIDKAQKVKQSISNAWDIPTSLHQLSSVGITEERDLLASAAVFLLRPTQSGERNLKQIQLSANKAFKLGNFELRKPHAADGEMAPVAAFTEVTAAPVNAGQEPAIEGAAALEPETEKPATEESYIEVPRTPKPQPPGKQPWNPRKWCIGLSFFFGFGAAGILAGINWRRLGKPKWVWPTIVLAIAGEAGFLALINALNSFGSRLLGYGIELGIGYLIAHLQRPAYEEWMDTYDTSGIKSPGWAIPIGVGIGSIVLILAGTFGFFGLQTSVAQKHLDIGNQYMNQGDYDLAIAEFNEMMKINPDEPTAYINRGAAYFKKQQMDLAIADFNKAIQLNPTFALTYRDRGIAYYYQGDFDAALADMEKAIQLDPRVAQSYLGRGRIYIKKGMIEKAVADFNKTLELSNDPTVRQQAEKLLTDLGK